MIAVYANGFDPADPLSVLGVGEFDPPPTPADWVEVEVRAAALNHHDLWSLRGVGLRKEQLPMILGTDAAGVDADGREVIVHAVISDADGDETLDPRRSLLSERHPGTLAEVVRVPARNLVPKPPELSFAEAACLPTAWLTAYKMVMVNAGLGPGGSLLVQGVGGGVASAAIAIAAAAGYTVYATSRDPDKRRRAVTELGATDAFEPGARLPHRVDAVIETVGAATWSHSIKCLRPGGTVVISGATSGDNPAHAELTRIFFLQLRIQGSTMGTRTELTELIDFVRRTGLRPVIDREIPLIEARHGFGLLDSGQVFGKIVLTR